MSINKVLYNVDQRNDTTAAEKATARANIGAQGALTAGQNITISNGVISADNTEYQAGHGLTLSNNTFAVDDTVLQGKLTAGSNIQLNGNTISATDTLYTAGSGLALNGTEFSNTAPNVKSDWNAAAGSAAEILNKPTIPTVNDGTLTIQRNGTNVATFTANQSSNATANISVPTDTSDLTNGAGFITSAQVPAQVNADWDSTSGASEILHKPTIPTVNDGTLTIQVNGTQLATFSANQSGNVTANITSGGADIVTRTNGQGGYVETPVSKLTLDTDFNQILTDGHEIGVFGPMPQSGDTGKMVVVNGDTLEYQTVPQAGTAIKTVSTTLPPVETDVSTMTLFTDGRVRADNSDIGLLAPTGTQAENGKVLVGTYAGSPGKFTANWGDVSTMVSTYPQIDYMGHTSYYVDLTQANYLYMEDGVCYDIMSNAGGSFTLHLMTNSTTTIHSKIYLWSEQANCMSGTIVYEDEAGEVAQLQYTYGGSSQTTMYALDVYARKVHVSGGISFDAYLCRVYDYPCANRDAYSYNEDLGKVVEYIEPL